jgi:hypothetical protein
MSNAPTTERTTLAAVAAGLLHIEHAAQAAAIRDHGADPVEQLDWVARQAARIADETRVSDDNTGEVAR